MSIRSIIDELEVIINEVDDIEGEASYGRDNTDGDIYLSEASSVLDDAWDKFNNICRWLETIKDAVDTIHSELDDLEVNEQPPPKVCQRCGTRE